jgi:hypothetical protein
MRWISRMVEIVVPPSHPCDPAEPPSRLSDSKACGRWSRRGRAVAIPGASETRYGCSSVVPMAEGPRAMNGPLRSPAVRPRSTRTAIGAWRRYRCTRQDRCVSWTRARLRSMPGGALRALVCRTGGGEMRVWTSEVALVSRSRVNWRVLADWTSCAHHITNGATQRALRALAAQAMKGAAWERRGNASAFLRSAPALREPDDVM